MNTDWWKKSVVYQIYPKSFNDTTGNGVGDLQGIVAKLNYLKTLGIDVIWLTPVYDSPQKDNGYDIRDYYKIHEEYGTMEDFEYLLKEAHARGIKVIMDLVVNHTSTEHEWFKQALADPDGKFRDYYIWKDGGDNKPPNNWQSKFGGSAWEHDPESGQYYLHLFDVTQADLNWENEELRQEVYDMMHFWFEKGIDGFRLDVINLISKDRRFLDDDGSVSPGDGRKFYTDGPRVHEYLNEMNEKVLSDYNVMTVGEMSSTTVDHCIKYSKTERKELNMTFNFHHLKVDYANGEKWTRSDFDFIQLKKVLSKWQVDMFEGGGWNALFWCNHDQPRIVSRFGDEGKYRNESAKMLATTIHMMHGTPYIYQGEEIGMTNPGFEEIGSYRDVESINAFEKMKNEGKSVKEILEILKQKSRDNSRTPMQWNAEKNTGFTEGEPWIDVAANYREVNTEKALLDSDSVFYHYKRLIELRKEYDIITNGDYQLIHKDDPQIFSYLRNQEDEKLLVVNNFYEKETEFRLPEQIGLTDRQSTVLLSNYPELKGNHERFKLRPYESVVFYFAKSC
ncbi:alpha,alpha-phosphotrehalase [Pseudalkalibacillus salsuginis]|uniref:alpha,alpha-phosphotrehalase n=1 Tax=Pseudalkalibacillus salsuginis TaxID=2910972 RepID=UPI001F2AD0CD|nr:alpha,alpha-phosphotrehalase [Pseudalkalibacillus salsuginis]MCF6410665.1 alpha,alpha-phosphotrehalase [Pseudalkalibacillus salsuginis]